MAKAYLTRISHFTFYSEGGEIVITSERHDDFEERHDWPEDWSASDVDLTQKLHEEYYMDLRKRFE